MPAQPREAREDAGRADSNPTSIRDRPSSDVAGSSSSSSCSSTPRSIIHGFQLQADQAQQAAPTPTAEHPVPATQGAADPVAVAQPTAAAAPDLFRVPGLWVTKPRSASLQDLFTVRRRVGTPRQGGVQAALGLDAAAAAISTHTPAWWGALSGCRREMAAAAAAGPTSSGAPSSGSGSGKGGGAGMCVCVQCGSGVGPPIYKTKMMGLAAAAPPARTLAKPGPPPLQ